MKELFGQRLREQRIKHGLTLEQLAEKSELSSNYIGMVERGLKEPGLATIVKLLNALNISADTLLCDLVPSASHVTDDEIRKLLSGHLCRCTGYENIFRAVKKTMLRRLGKDAEADEV